MCRRHALPQRNGQRAQRTTVHVNEGSQRTRHFHFPWPDAGGWLLLATLNSPGFGAKSLARGLRETVNCHLFRLEGRNHSRQTRRRTPPSGLLSSPAIGSASSTLRRRRDARLRGISGRTRCSTGMGRQSGLPAGGRRVDLGQCQGVTGPIDKPRPTHLGDGTRGSVHVGASRSPRGNASWRSDAPRG